MAAGETCSFLIDKFTNVKNEDNLNKWNKNTPGWVGLSKQFAYPDSSQLSKEEEISSKNYKNHHSKSSDVINKFDVSLLKFNRKEIVDNAIEQAKELYQRYFEKIPFVHVNNVPTLLLPQNAFNKLLSNNKGLGNLLLINDPTMHDYAKVKMSSVYWHNNNLLIWFPVFRELLSQSLFHKALAIQKYYPEFVFSLNYTYKYIRDNSEIFVSEILSKLINFYIHAMDNPFMDITDISVTATYGAGQEIDLEINDFIKSLDLYRIILIYKRLTSNIKNLEAFIDELTFDYLEFQNNNNSLNLDQIIVNLKRLRGLLSPNIFRKEQIIIQINLIIIRRSN